MRETAIVAAPAKLNLRLVVHAREESGYHQVETLFVAVSLADRVRVERGGTGIEVEVEDVDLGPPEDNLAYRAADAFYGAAGLEPGTRITIEKRIPVAAGLGGGSSDAAATLRALNRLYGEPIRDDDLRAIGSTLGSDVPFFLTPSTLALAWGRGERLLSLPPLGSAPVLVAVGGAGIATVEAYRALSVERGGEERREPGGCVLPVEAFRDWEGVEEFATNDFEEVVFRARPHLERVRDGFLDTSPRFTLLAGSGSSVFAVYRGEDRLEEAHEVMSHRFPGTVFLPAQTLTAVPPVAVE